MRLRLRCLPLLALLASCLLLPGVAHAQKKGGGGTTAPPVTYMLRWLPVGERVHDLNNDADYVGEFNDGVAVTPIVSLQGTTCNVNALVNDPTWEIVTAVALSERHDGAVHVVGYSFRNGVRRRRAYRLTLALSSTGAPSVRELRNLETLPDDFRSQATGVNALGHVVGLSSAGPFFYSDAEGLVPFTAYSLGWDDYPHIAESGYVGFGFVDSATGNKMVAVWDPLTGQFQTKSLGSYGSLFGINPAGNFCGNTTDRTGLKRIGYAYFNGVFKDLSATMSDATAINAANNVLGQNTKYQYLYLYLYILNKTYRVDQLFATANSAVDVNLWNSYGAPTAVDLTDSGVIAGWFIIPETKNVCHSFLLFPVSP